jgi:3-hydroxyisobutyrate dehydrogenase
MASEQFGFIGLGNMGQPMARNICEAGHGLIVHDIAGTADRAPKGAEVAQSNGELARRATVVALSLPSLDANRAVIREIVEAGNAGSVVIDTCTIGPEAAAENAKALAAAGIHYVDAPVSGLKVRAEEGTLASMIAGSNEAIARARPLIEGYSRAVFVVGSEPGQGQRMKVVNNAIYIASLVTVSEALAYGEKGGLDLNGMLEVINASSGQSLTTQQVFPTYMATDPLGWSGADALIIEKDLKLFVEGAAREATPGSAITRVFDTIKAFSDEDPKQDKAEIYHFIRDRL